MDTRIAYKRASGSEELREAIVDAVTDIVSERSPDRSSTADADVHESELSDCVIVVHSDRVVVLPVDCPRGERTDDVLEITGEFSDDGFGYALEQLVHASYLEGIDIQGSWSLRTVSGMPDWEVEITEVTKPICDQ